MDAEDEAFALAAALQRPPPNAPAPDARPPRGRGRGRGRGGGEVAAAEPAAAVVAIVPVAIEGLLPPNAIVPFVRPPPAAHYAQRSWALLCHARSQKKEKRLVQECADEKEKLVALQDRVTDVAEAFPVVAVACGLARSRTPFTARRAAMIERLAFAPTIRGDVPVRVVQAVACSTTAKALLNVQTGCAVSLHLPHGRSSSSSVAEAVSTDRRVHVLCGMWDETTQRINAFIQAAKRLPGEIVSSRKVGAQVMMCVFYMQVFINNSLSSAEPYFSRAACLASTTANFLLECILSRVPWPLDNADEMMQYALQCASLILLFCFDRASPNWSLCNWLWQLMFSETYPDVLAHGEPCSLHGGALVANSPAAGKEITTRCHTFSSFMRYWRSAMGMRDCIVATIMANYRVVYEQRPPELKAKAQVIADYLTTGDGDSANEDDCDNELEAQDRDRRRQRARKRHKALVQAMVDVVDIGSPGPFTHYCYVEDPTVGRVGSKCCTHESEGPDKLIVPILNVFIGRGWDAENPGRWFYLAKLLRKMLLGILTKNVLPDALSLMKSNWSLDDSMAAQLARALAADAEDWSSKTRLRLLRICQTFCNEGNQRLMGTMTLGLRCVMHVMYEIIGRQVSLGGLLDEKTSPIAGSRQSLLELLETGMHGPRWVLQAAVNPSGEYTDEDIFWTRAYLLQLDAAWCYLGFPGDIPFRKGWGDVS